MGDAYGASKEVARANRAFYDAFERLDREAMAEVWLDDAKAKCVHPGWEELVGVDLVLVSWDAIFASTESIEIELTDLAVEVEGSFAWVTNVENIRSVSDGREQKARIVTTNLFVRRAGVWKMVLHHASPVLRERGGG